MIKLIRFIAVIVALVSFWSVYSRPEVREALFMAMDSDSEYYENDYDGERDDSEYAYDDYDTDYDY